MQARIAAEMKRTDLTIVPSSMTLTPIQSAIGDAIYYYQQKRFFFQETTDFTTTTVAGTNLYNLPQDLLSIDKVTIEDANAGVEIELHRRDIGWILARDTTIPLVQGMPTDYAEYANQVRLYPTPDSGISSGNYILGFYYRGMIPPPVNQGDQGYWMTTGELMIRSMAKSLLYAQWLKNPDQAAAEFKISDGQYQELSGTSAANQFTGSTKPHRF